MHTILAADKVAHDKDLLDIAVLGDDSLLQGMAYAATLLANAAKVSHGQKALYLLAKSVEIAAELGVEGFAVRVADGTIRYTYPSGEFEL